MSFSCLIFDDEASAVAEISFLIGKHAPGWEISGIASTIDDCRKQLKTQTTDIIFSDIHFGNEIIFDVLPELRDFKGDIIFISGDNGFASEAFQMSAINYLLKPINENHFIQTLQRYKKKNTGESDSSFRELLYHNLKEDHPAHKKMAFNTSAGYIIKELNDIIYAKADSNYTEVHFLNNEKILVAKTMLDYEKMLDKFGFFRIHQSYLVNFKYVTKFDTEELQLHLNTNEVLPVSSRKKTLLLETMRRVF